ncbi:MAG TPA: response regulator [Ruminiclostridium sp.]
MKTVMIVDDEKPARELLKMLISWETAGYCIISEANDGIEAIEQYLQFSPDLIITDIQMPQMDGLILIKEIKKINNDQKIIVLSCHENFNYAREVMKLGIFDYLIKDSLTPEDLFTVLRSTSYSKSVDQSTLNFKGIIDEKKSHALWGIINNSIDLSNYANALKTCDLYDNCQFFFIHAIIDTNTTNNFSSEITNAIAEVLTSKGGAICNLDNSHYVILVIAKSSHSQLEMLSQQCTTAKSISVCMEKITGCIITSGVSRISSDVKLIKEKNLEAQQALGYRVFLGKGKILYFDIIQNSSRNIKIELIDIRIQNIKSALYQKDQATLSNELKNLYLSDLQGILQYNYLQHVSALLLGLITAACSEFNILYKNLFIDGTIPLDIIGNLETVEEMLLWFTEKFHTLIKIIEAISNDQYSRQVRIIVRYIKDHYIEDIGLESISQLYNLHKVQLARMFKENTGISVNGYIRKIRIQEAKTLLQNSNLNINEIVYSVGFQNAQSFYSIFKKLVGVTPSEFRDM